MSYIEIRDLETGQVEVLGDKDQHKKAEGIPTKERSQRDMDEAEKETA